MHCSRNGEDPAPCDDVESDVLGERHSLEYPVRGYAQTRYPEDESVLPLDTDWSLFKEDASPK